jgi:hypothetical protein
MGLSPRRLTQQFVESLTWNGKRTFIRDSDLKGFMVVVNRTGPRVKQERAQIFSGDARFHQALTA